MQNIEHGILTQKLESILESGPPAEAQGPLVEAVRDVRPEDIAEVLGDFAADEKLRIFEAAPADRQAQVLAETDPTTRQQLVELLPAAAVATLVEGLEPDDAADILELIPEDDQAALLTLLAPELAIEVRDLLQHDPDSAGGIMTSDLIAVDQDQTAKEVLVILQQTLDTEVVAYVYVVDGEERLQGVISIREIIAARPEDRIGDIMHEDVIYAHVLDDQEAVANLARKYNLNSVPVVDDNRHLLGVATIDDIVDIISEEADEDIYRLAGSPASHPAQQPILRRALVRTPWLMLSLVAGFIIVYMQKGQLGSPPAGTGWEPLLLSAFLPLVIGLSGGVGTQSATLIARGLATGEVDVSQTTRVFLQELWIGISIGLFMGFVVMVGIYGFHHLTTTMPFSTETFPIAVGIGLMSGVLLATVCGTVIPLLCHWLKIDPALVAGPFVTSFNDVVGAFTFLAIGNAILT